MQAEEQEYAKAFNNGYVLAKFEPVMLNSVLKNVNGNTNYLEGLLNGKEQYEHEQILSLDQQRDRSQDHNLER